MPPLQPDRPLVLTDPFFKIPMPFSAALTPLKIAPDGSRSPTAMAALNAAPLFASIGAPNS